MRGISRTGALIIAVSLVIGVSLIGIGAASLLRRGIGSISVVPTTVSPGTVIIVQGFSWPAGSQIVVALRDPANPAAEAVCATTAADERGRFVVSFVFPADARWSALPQVLLAAHVAGDSRSATQTLNLAGQPPVPITTSEPAATETPEPAPTHTAAPPTQTTAPAEPTPTSTPRPGEQKDAWWGEYYGNATLSGTPALSRWDEQIDFQWRADSPASGIPADLFSVRWTGRWSLAAGGYRFSVTADDGVRMWIDRQLVLDEWHDAAGVTYSFDAFLEQGEHELCIEYYESRGDAIARVRWESLGSSAGSRYPGWRAEYYDNRQLAYRPVRILNNPGLSFNWGSGAPGLGLPADDFSARWTRKVTFDEGIYRFHAEVDDGVRLWIDGTLLVIGEWHDSPGTHYVADCPLSGEHTLQVEYFEHAGEARVRVWWEKRPEPTATCTPTATPTAPPSPPPTATQTPTLTPTPTETATATLVPPTATSQAITPRPPTATPTRTTTPTPSPSATPTRTATPTPSPSATPTHTATPEPSPTPTDTATPEPSPTPTDTATPEPSATPAEEPSPTPTVQGAVDPLEASYRPLLGIPEEAFQEQVPEVSGVVEDWKELSRPPFFRFELRTAEGESYLVEGPPEEVIMLQPPARSLASSLLGWLLPRPERSREERISPLFAGRPPKSGNTLCVTGVLTGSTLIAERVDVQAGRRLRHWYHRGLLAEGEVNAHTAALYSGLNVWVTTTLSSTQRLVDEDLSGLLTAYPDQPAVVTGVMTASGRLERPRIYIRSGDVYVPIYPGCRPEAVASN